MNQAAAARGFAWKADDNGSSDLARALETAVSVCFGGRGSRVTASGSSRRSGFHKTPRALSYTRNLASYDVQRTHTLRETAPALHQ